VLDLGLGALLRGWCTYGEAFWLGCSLVDALWHFNSRQRVNDWVRHGCCVGLMLRLCFMNVVDLRLGYGEERRFPCL
jgi:hypothetical protein